MLTNIDAMDLKPSPPSVEPMTLWRALAYLGVGLTIMTGMGFVINANALVTELTTAHKTLIAQHIDAERDRHKLLLVAMQTCKNGAKTELAVLACELKGGNP